MKDHTIPLTLISILADGEFHSGEQLGEQLGMSRAAINKHIQTLRDWGVDVFTVPGSMYWRLEQGPAAAIGLSLVIGIVIAEVLQQLGAEQVRVKWPNDIYLQDRKLSGILVELTGKTGDAAQIVSGAGINLMMRRVESDVVNQGWISLQEAGD